MTQDQAMKLIEKTQELLATGDALHAIAQAMAYAGEPQERYQPLIDACHHLAAATSSTIQAWEVSRDYELH